jgi:hypothetical protein
VCRRLEGKDLRIPLLLSEGPAARIYGTRTTKRNMDAGEPGAIEPQIDLIADLNAEDGRLTGNLAIK